MHSTVYRQFVLEFFSTFQIPIVDDEMKKAAGDVTEEGT